jgi:hypothetical protein
MAGSGDLSETGKKAMRLTLSQIAGFGGSRGWRVVRRRDWRGLGEWLDTVAVSLLWSPPARGEGSREGGNGEREWWGLRCRLGLHLRAWARDVEATAELGRHAAKLFCPSATTRSLSEP